MAWKTIIVYEFRLKNQGYMKNNSINNSKNDEGQRQADSAAGRLPAGPDCYTFYCHMTWHAK